MSQADVSNAQRRSIAIDAMGGPCAVRIVDGAVQACRAGAGPLILVGDEARIQAELDHFGLENLPIKIEHASEVIAMGDNPGRAARSKRGSSMHRCFELLKAGDACATLSAGNSGAFLGVGLLSVRRVEGCDRPAIATSLPTATKPTVLLDIGANVEVRAAHLVQFALMGAAYSSIRHGVERPTVALLSNGSEVNKGTDTLREAHRLLTQTPLNYIGFVEGRDLPEGCADVVVTDGHTGNVVLKLCEGIVGSLFKRIRAAVQANWFSNLASVALKGPLESLHEELDWENTGGAPLLGLNGLAMVAHGRSTSKAIAQSIIRTRAYSEVGLMDAVEDALAESAPTELTSTTELPLTQTTGERERPDEN